LHEDRREGAEALPYNDPREGAEALPYNDPRQGAEALPYNGPRQRAEAPPLQEGVVFGSGFEEDWDVFVCLVPEDEELLVGTAGVLHFPAPCMTAGQP